MVYKKHSILKSYSKINIFLNILKKKTKLHLIHSFVLQINLIDKIKIQESSQKKDKIIFKGTNIKKISKNNSITKILKLLRQKKILNNKYFKITIYKNIPIGAGLGGSSSNATTLLNYLIKKFNLKISRQKTLKLLSLIGKDCSLFIDTKPKLIFNYGEKFKQIKFRTRLRLLIIYPNKISLSKSVYKKNNTFSSALKIEKILSKKKLNYNLLKNDLLEASSRLTPEIPGILKLFSKINKCKYYNITGSGSACFGIFGDKKSLLNARKTFKRKYRNYWTASVKTIN